MKKTLRGAVLLTAALVAIAAVALAAVSPEAPASAPATIADAGILIIPEGARLLDVEYTPRGASSQVSNFTVIVEDTTDGQQYILHYDFPFVRESRPAWVFRTQGVPMEELTR